ncbi:MAG: winged helix-turn-helix transcriptional regulator [Acidobacteria bacterium]|nr:winged helix-turn-helix transcriptional regulator [Acidobacteriota bacterium]
MLPQLLARFATFVGGKLRRAGARHSLNSAQMNALVYLAQANRYSNTPAAVAEFLGLTKGTVSQTLLALERGKWLERIPDRRDRRVVRLQLTRNAQRLIANFETSLVEGMPAGQRSHLEQSLSACIQSLQHSPSPRAFGVCRTCRSFQIEGPSIFRCGLTKEPLPAAQILKLCREHTVPEPA